MAHTCGKHLTRENREVIAQGLMSGDSARSIAKRIDVSPSTVVREVQKNRSIHIRKPPKGKLPAIRCAHYRTCCLQAKACRKCGSAYTLCKKCYTHDCTASCKQFELLVCPETCRWPYVCPARCSKRAHCGYPLCSYSAFEADQLAQARLVQSRQGIDLTEEELIGLRARIEPLLKQGQSVEAIWQTHKDELAVCVRTIYNYQEKGILLIPDLEFPNKVRFKPRKEPKVYTRERLDRSGRSYEDFEALGLEDKVRVCQADSVVGYARNKQDLLSLHKVCASMHLYLLKAHADPAATVACLDALEITLGSRLAFEALFGIFLADRGIEFDDWEGMERSVLEPGHRRMRVFYCDPMATNQKSQCERDHVELRRILPKGRSDFDALSVSDVATITSHINSYPKARLGGRCGFDLAQGLFPREFLDMLGLEKLEPDQVILRPSLLAHVVQR